MIISIRFNDMESDCKGRFFIALVLVLYSAHTFEGRCYCTIFIPRGILLCSYKESLPQKNPEGPTPQAPNPIIYGAFGFQILWLIWSRINVVVVEGTNCYWSILLAKRYTLRCCRKGEIVSSKTSLIYLNFQTNS